MRIIGARSHKHIPTKLIVYYYIISIESIMSISLYLSAFFLNVSQKDCDYVYASAGIETLISEVDCQVGVRC